MMALGLSVAVLAWGAFVIAAVCLILGSILGYSLGYRDGMVSRWGRE